MVGAAIANADGPVAMLKPLPSKVVVVVPVAPEEYRHLNQAGAYTEVQVSDWAEKRTCPVSGSSALFATQPFRAGDVLARFEAKAVLQEPNYLTVQLGDTTHVMLSPDWLQYINHSCSPNVFFDTEKMQLEALTAIAPRDELCFFYPSSEWCMESPFKCCCGTAACIGTIGGAARLSQEQLAKLGDMRFTTFIHKKLAAVAAEE